MKEISDKKRAQFALEVLRAHNKLREHHGTEALAFEKKIMEDAQNYAEKCARSGAIIPRDQVSSYGENIWGLTTNSSDWDDLHGGRPVERWYSEIDRYTFGQEPRDNVAGHLAQLLWSATKYLGVGVAANENGQIYVICEYYPAGNYLGDYAQNVKPLQKLYTHEEADEISIPSLTRLSLSNASDPTSPICIPIPNNTRTVEELASIELYTLRYHNQKRKLHDLKPLNYTRKLESLAQDWAEHLLKNGTFYHRPNNQYGENIYFYTATFHLDDEQSIEKAVDAWYNEIDFYKAFCREPTLEELTMGNPTGHFTQVVWNATSLVGLGLARKYSDNSHLVVVVANYAPAGNILGKFKNNVSRPVAWLTKLGDVKTVASSDQPPSELSENENFTASFQNLAMSDLMRSELPLGSVQHFTAKDPHESGKSLTSPSVMRKSVEKKNSTTKVAPKDTANKTVTSKVDSTKNTSKVLLDSAKNTSKVSTPRSGLSKTANSLNGTTRRWSSNVAIKREARGLRIFSERVKDMSSTAGCSKK